MVKNISVTVELFDDSDVEAEHDLETSKQKFEHLLLASIGKRYPKVRTNVVFGEYAGVVVSASTSEERTKTVRDVSQLVEELRVDRFEKWAVARD